MFCTIIFLIIRCLCLTPYHRQHSQTLPSSRLQVLLSTQLLSVITSSTHTYNNMRYEGVSVKCSIVPFRYRGSHLFQAKLLLLYCTFPCFFLRILKHYCACSGSNKNIYHAYVMSVMCVCMFLAATWLVGSESHPCVRPNMAFFSFR